MSKPSIRNIHKFINIDRKWMEDVELDDGFSVLHFVWDSDNEKIDNIAAEEFRYGLKDKKKSLMWVEELKRESGWKEGEYIYAFTKTNADGYYNVFYKKSKEDFTWYNVIIEKSGYVSMQYFNHYSWDEDDDIKRAGFIRVSSIYNDKNTK